MTLNIESFLQNNKIMPLILNSKKVLMLICIILLNFFVNAQTKYSGFIKTKVNNPIERYYIFCFYEGSMSNHIIVLDKKHKKITEIITDSILLQNIDSLNVFNKCDSLVNKSLFIEGHYFSNKKESSYTRKKGFRRTFGSFATFYPNGRIYSIGFCADGGKHIGFISYFKKNGTLIETLNLKNYLIDQIINVRDPFNYKDKKTPILVGASLSN